MFPASSNGGGMSLAFPDLCKTPVPILGVIPIPYANIAQCSQAKGSTCSSKVKIENKKTMTKKSEVSRTQGDEPGVQKGVVSSKHMDKCKRGAGFSKVKVEGAAIVSTLRPTTNNGGSANAPPGQQLSPSQTKVICLG